MNHQDTPSRNVCPIARAAVRSEVQVAYDALVGFCETCDSSFWKFEIELIVRVAVLGVCLIRLFFTARYERLDLRPFLEDGDHRPGDVYAERTLKTVYGTVTYGRHYLQARGGGSGFFPLDVDLGLTTDRLSPWVMQWVARLASRMSFSAARMVCQAALNWAPATETIEQVVLGMGRKAAPFMAQLEPPPTEEEGEVLVIEMDGKCPPTATSSELAKRRGRRKPRCKQACRCGCQRHRGRARREARGSKKRRR